MPNEYMPNNEKNNPKIEIQTGENNPILRKKTEIIKEITPEIEKLIEDMFEICLIHDGVGLAANQIGKSISLFVIRLRNAGKDIFLNAYLNPEIINLSSKTILKEEGCLSLPGFFAKIKRAENITIKYQDRLGAEQIIEASGFLARIIQHETDHLNGKLITDRVKNDGRPKINKK